jgi:hypothetical protein
MNISDLINPLPLIVLTFFIIYLFGLRRLGRP